MESLTHFPKFDSRSWRIYWVREERVLRRGRGRKKTGRTPRFPSLSQCAVKRSSAYVPAPLEFCSSSRNEGKEGKVWEIGEVSWHTGPPTYFTESERKTEIFMDENGFHAAVTAECVFLQRAHMSWCDFNYCSGIRALTKHIDICTHLHAHRYP